MSYFVISDLHFGHEKMYEYCDRPIGFEDKIIDNLSSIKDDDVLIHLGDFCFGNDALWHYRFMDSVKGKKWFIRGNHDRKTDTWYLNMGWDVVANRIDLHKYGKCIALTHKPLGFIDKFVNVHGHTHKPNPDYMAGRFSVFMEHHYSPQRLRKVIGL